MANLTVIKREPTANPEVVRVLREILESAEKGELLSFALVGTDDEGSFYQAYLRYQDLPGTVFALEKFKLDLITED